MKENFKKLINEICNEENIKYTYLSKDWVIMLEKDGKTKFISGYKFDSNSHSIGLIMDDKYALYEVLNSKNIPVIKHYIAYSGATTCDYAIGCNSKEYVERIFKENNNNIVIKPNDGTCGHNVYNITDINEIDIILEKLFKSNFSICICPYYNIKNEYRAIVLNGKIKLIYKKIKPVVIGTGNNTIRELLLDFNYNYFKHKLNDKIYDRILKKDEIYEYNWKFNLSRGAKAEKIDNIELINNLTVIVKNITNKLDIRFASIDIVETDKKELLVLEINSGVMTENYLNMYPNEYNNIKEIYREAIKSLF